MSILVLGSIHMDKNYKLHHLPRKGETILALDSYESFGGKGLNQAIACARSGGKVQLLGSLGEDEAGKKIKDLLRDEGLDPDLILDQKGPTGAASIYVDQEGQNTIVVTPGADALIKKEDLEDKKDFFKKADYLVLQFELPLEIIYKALEMAKDYELTTIVNPAPAQETFDPSYYPYIDYLVPNESELALLSGEKQEKDLENSQALALLDQGVGKVLLTQGSRGSTLYTKEATIHVPAEKGQVKDTTGAGDSYLGAFVKAIAQGATEKDAMLFATSYALKTIASYGAISAMVDLRK